MSESTKIEDLELTEIQLSTNKEFEAPLQDYGRIAMAYLKDQNQPLYHMKLAEGTLMEYLHSLEEQAISREIQLLKSGLKKNPYPTENDQLKNIQHLNNLLSQIREIVTQEMLQTIPVNPLPIGQDITVN
ncbi:TnpV protein [Enterococcus termitis]